jgi:hypothetical protein
VCCVSFVWTQSFFSPSSIYILNVSAQIDIWQNNPPWAFFLKKWNCYLFKNWTISDRYNLLAIVPLLPTHTLLSLWIMAQVRDYRSDVLSSSVSTSEKKRRKQTLVWFLSYFFPFQRVTFFLDNFVDRCFGFSSFSGSSHGQSLKKALRELFEYIGSLLFTRTYTSFIRSGWKQDFGGLSNIGNCIPTMTSQNLRSFVLRLELQLKLYSMLAVERSTWRTKCISANVHPTEGFLPFRLKRLQAPSNHIWAERVGAGDDEGNSEKRDDTVRKSHSYLLVDVDILLMGWSFY